MSSPVTALTYDSDLVYDSSVEYDPYSPSQQQTIPLALPHLAVPVTLNADGSLSVWEQGTAEEIAQSVEVICGTVLGSRPVVPTFGVPDQTFVQPNTLAVTAAINRWEQRASVQVTANTEDTSGVSSIVVSVKPAQAKVVTSA